MILLPVVIPQPTTVRRPLVPALLQEFVPPREQDQENVLSAGSWPPSRWARHWLALSARPATASATRVVTTCRTSSGAKGRRCCSSTVFPTPAMRFCCPSLGCLPSSSALLVRAPT